MTKSSLVPVISIDGPAGSGKSSVSSRLAQKLGFTFLSTGSFYRGLAYFAHQKGADFSDEQQLVDLIDSPEWKIVADPGETRVEVFGKDVTPLIHNEDVGALASKVSRSPNVRKALLEPQRKFRKPPGLVAEGRDCGTVVFPDSIVKIYLTADLEARADRRVNQEKSGASRAAIKEAQAKRDEADSTRQAAPMVKAPDAVEVDTSRLTIDEVVDKILEISRRKLKP